MKRLGIKLICAIAGLGDEQAMKPLIYVTSLLMAALLGFGIHRASPCTVKTVTEILSRHKIYMLKVLLPRVLCMWPSAQERKNFIKADHIGIQTKVCKIHK